MDQKNLGPTVFDINKPRTYGAAPSARPVITGHQPMMPDPMVTPHETPLLRGSRISVKVDESPNLLATMEGEPQLSPPFKSRTDSNSAAQRSPYMPVSDLTGIAGEQPRTSIRSMKANEISDEQVVTANPRPSVFGSSNNHRPVNEGGSPKQRKPRGKLWLLSLLILVLLAGAYAAIDKGLILGSVNLPVHIFKKTDTAATNSGSTSPSTQVSIPSGFTNTKLVGANLTFAYPTDWGVPTAAVDQGFTKRTKDGKADTPHAYVVTFPNNKDIELAVTSSKVLPPVRPAPLYYDFLGWCIGTVDGKYYSSALYYVTENNVDTPGTVACTQGLSGVAKLTSDTIVQTNLKSTDGKSAGDLYTKNLTNNPNFAVIYVKDATMKNGDLVQTLLGTIQNTQ
ncbi:MAG: hypothetical protein Q7R60_02420 [bacterium]|nr:hypothetical protein [bacterium]